MFNDKFKFFLKHDNFIQNNIAELKSIDLFSKEKTAHLKEVEREILYNTFTINSCNYFYYKVYESLIFTIKDYFNYFNHKKEHCWLACWTNCLSTRHFNPIDTIKYYGYVNIIPKCNHIFTDINNNFLYEIEDTPGQIYIGQFKQFYFKDRLKNHEFKNQFNLEFGVVEDDEIQDVSNLIPIVF